LVFFGELAFVVQVQQLVLVDIQGLFQQHSSLMMVEFGVDVIV
jgi:hypothetical protein